MNAITTRTFKSGNSEAVRLPKGFGFGAGTDIRIERVGDTLVLTAVDAEASGLARLHAMLDRLDALPPPSHPREERDSDWWLDRAQL